MSGDIVVGKVVGMLIDFNQALDAIPHEIKMNKVKCYGMRGMESECVRSYLKNRKQFAKMGESQSLCLDTVYGVPQGSVLGQYAIHLTHQQYIQDITSYKIHVFQ